MARFNSGDDIGKHAEHVSHGQKRKPTPKGMMSIMAMSMMASSRSQQNNGITGRMGIFMRSMEAPKRTDFLVAYGLCNAYDTSTCWVKENASAPNVPDVDLVGWMEELERAVNEWNTEVAVQRDDSWGKDVDGNGNDECGS